MAKKALSAPEIPLCINVLRLLNYRLAPDELILFDWLTVKQISFKYKPFHYSQARVEEETRIRRTRQEVIIKQFSALGFLKTDIKVNSVTRGRVRYYSVDFSVLADVDVLVEIIMPQTTLFRDFILYFAYHATMQKKSKEEQLKPASAINHEAAARIYQLLSQVYDERRQYYNDGGLTGDVKPERSKSAMQLQHNKPIERKLAKLADYYNDNSIKNAFLAYVDEILTQKKEPENLMYYFLSFDETSDCFGVVNHCLNYFTLHYSYSSNS